MAFLFVRAHWMDLGAKDPGYVLDSTDMHQEGLIFPGTKVVKRGRLDQRDHRADPLQLAACRELVIGDIHAQMAAMRTGERR